MYKVTGFLYEFDKKGRFKTRIYYTFAKDLTWSQAKEQRRAIRRAMIVRQHVPISG